MTLRHAAETTIFSRRRRATPPLDHAKQAINLIGAVEVQVDRVHVIEVAERNSELSGEVGGVDARGDTDELQSLVRNSLTQAIDQESGRGPRAQPDDHSRFHQLGRRPGRPVLRGFGLAHEMRHDRCRPYLFEVGNLCYNAVRLESVRLGSRSSENRGDQIRTGDLLLPRQAR